MSTETIAKGESLIMDIKVIRDMAVSMADKVYDMLELTQKGFMEHKTEFLASAMKIENELNAMEKLLTRSILELSGESRKNEKDLVALEQMVEMFERMGDEAANLVERIEIKIHEKLLFSEAGVEQFNETYNAMKQSVNIMRDFLKAKNSILKRRVIDNGFHVKELVERYRKEHANRLVRGMCTQMGANMYFDMLDFTGNLARHASNIVKLF
ncbi:MAG: PhoU domain-containing protein [Candidatus Omnitrophota bacterium]|nr:PhoU domain-containing protein [Candidatus Omnitrophota bacterium]